MNSAPWFALFAVAFAALALSLAMENARRLDALEKLLEETGLAPARREDGPGE